MKLLVLTTTFPGVPGDATPQFVYELARRMPGEVHVLAPQKGDFPTHERWGDLHIHRARFWPTSHRFTDHAIVPTLRKKPWMAIQVPFFLLAFAAATWRLHRRHRFDRVHAHWIVPNGLLALLCTDAPIIITSHGADIWGLRWLDHLKRWTLRRASAVTAVSRAIATRIKTIADVDATIIPMGVDGERFVPKRHARKDEILFVGRLSEKKGVRYAIEAMPHVRKRLPKAHLTIVGDGELRGELEDLVRRKRLDAAVTFEGALPNSQLPALYAKADVFVGPSIVAKGGDREGVPVTFMEALACGTPVVTTDLEGNKDIITPGAGRMVPQRDAKALASALIEMLERKPAEVRKDVLARFGWPTIARRYEKVLE